MAAEPVEGKDYFKVEPPLPPADPAKVVVTEFFSYQCPHCYRVREVIRGVDCRPAHGRQD